jgi:hypothetical protein
MLDNAGQLLEQVEATYASMKSYSDLGSVDQHLMPDDAVLRTNFSTLYARPNLFRFECSRRHPYPPLRHLVTRHVVGFDGFGAYALRQEYDMPPTLQTRQDLSHAVSRVAGASSGSAHNIARLLGQVHGLCMLDLLEPRLADDELVGGVPCHCVCALLPAGGERKVSFERNTLLLRRVQTHRGKISLDEMHRVIRVNLPLDDALFNIDSPDFSTMQGQDVRGLDAESD